MNIWKDINCVDILLRRLSAIEEDNNWKLIFFFNTCGRAVVKREGVKRGSERVQ